MRRIAIAVSGGADSLYALVSLKAEGHDVLAFHAQLSDNSAPILPLTKLCQEQGVEFHVLDLQTEFQQLITKPFALAYMQGQTPNPCASCNALIKFGLLKNWAIEQRAALATGHYLNVSQHPKYGLALSQGIDISKDQSYFLALTPKEQLENTVFPLGQMHKTAVRTYLESAGFAVPVPKESQEICFIPNNDYREYLQATGLKLPQGGPMVLTDGRILGRHKGLWQYTEGQRKGLGIGFAEPLYVLAKDRSRNSLVLGTKSEVMISGCVVKNLNFFVPYDLWPHDVLARIRYRQQAVPVDVRLFKQGLLMRFHKPELPSAPGQVVAIYDANNYLLAGGILSKD